MVSGIGHALDTACIDLLNISAKFCENSESLILYNKHIIPQQELLTIN